FGKFKVNLTNGRTSLSPQICTDCALWCKKKDQNICIQQFGFAWSNKMVHWEDLFIVAVIYSLFYQEFEVSILERIEEINSCPRWITKNMNLENQRYILKNDLERMPLSPFLEELKARYLNGTLSREIFEFHLRRKDLDESKR
ncbi:MAG: hypothetical protein ACFFBD_18770, partial [Candidatus Hodarchaeota archaeon]